jgi:hypothetical protein
MKFPAALKKLRFSTRAATIAFLIVFVGMFLTIVVTGPYPSWYQDALEILFLAPGSAVQAVFWCLNISLLMYSGPLAVLHISCVAWAGVAGLIWPLVSRHEKSSVVTKAVRHHRILGCLAVIHAFLLLLGISVAYRGPSGWFVQLWVMLAISWIFWPVVLILHSERSLFRIAAPLVIAVPLFFFYKLPPPHSFGLDSLELSPWNLLRYATAYRAGQADARKDIQADRLIIESAFFIAGPDFPITYKEKYKIQERPAAPSDLIDNQGHASGYNQVSLTEIERRFGKEMIDSAAAEAAVEHAKDEWGVEEFRRAYPDATLYQSLVRDGDNDTRYVDFRYALKDSNMRLEETRVFKKQNDGSWNMIEKGSPHPSAKQTDE